MWRAAMWRYILFNHSPCESVAFSLMQAAMWGRSCCALLVALFGAGACPGRVVDLGSS